MFVLALVLAAGGHKPLLDALTAMRYEWLSRPATGNIVVVAIDSPSIEAIGVWPWPRTIHAQLIERLETASASDIVFDVDFSTASNPEADQKLEDTLQAAGGSVVLPAFRQRLADRRNGKSFHVDRPLPRFSAHAWTATVNVEADSDGLVRRYPYGDILNGKFVPSAGALLAGAYGDAKPPFLIDFGIRAASVPIVSYIDVINGDPTVTAMLRNKKVIVGATALELGDRVNVPNGKVIAGAVLQVLAAESILQGRTLQVSSGVVTLAGLAILGLMMLASWRRGPAGARVLILFSIAAAIEVAALVVQVGMAVVLDTVFFHAAIAAYLLAMALDEVDVRSLLGTIAERRFHRVAMSIGDGLICVDRNGRITLWNAAATAIFSWRSDEMIGQPFERIFASNNARAGGACRITELSPESLKTAGGLVMELEGCRKNGDRFPFEVCFSAWEGADGLQYGAVLRDISVRKREEERIRYLAQYDTLTGLPNRSTLYEQLATKLAAAKANGTTVALLMLDLDKFKDINDSLGHTRGDGVLCDVARRLIDRVGDAGIVARWGGDEFAILLAGADAAERADKLGDAISESFRTSELVVAGNRFNVKCSIGVALYPRDCDDVQQLFANADLAMFRAKAAGKGRHLFFNRAIRDELEKRLSLTAELERASARGEFELFYQPQIRLRDGRLAGAEALIRWRHPDRGLVSPGEFIPVLNMTSLSDPVALWVMETACRQGRLWHQQGHGIRIGVNLSPSQFKSGDLVRTTATVLTDTGLPPSLLELEVTENILLADDEGALDIFRRLRDLGVHLAWDDFGTGYASLNYLKKFPLNRLKIDQLFVNELKPGSNDAAIVDYTIKLSRVLGLTVTAEGIENRSTVDLLTQMGCDEGQGYFFGRPLPVAEFERQFLANSHLAQPAFTGAGKAAA